ncbi:hypothetical protein MGH68_01855 [Erysipelothrix sp. D19-032]
MKRVNKIKKMTDVDGFDANFWALLRGLLLARTDNVHDWSTHSRICRLYPWCNWTSNIQEAKIMA